MVFECCAEGCRLILLLVPCIPTTASPWGVPPFFLFLSLSHSPLEPFQANAHIIVHGYFLPFFILHIEV